MESPNSLKIKYFIMLKIIMVTDHGGKIKTPVLAKSLSKL